MKLGIEYSFNRLDIIILPFDNLNQVYLFTISLEGFNHMYGVIEEYPDIEYDDKNYNVDYDDDDDDYNSHYDEPANDGRLRIIGVDMI
jgi:hypothetical protein